MEVIYEEWDLVESLFHAHTKVKAVHTYLIDEYCSQVEVRTYRRYALNRASF